MFQFLHIIKQVYCLAASGVVLYIYKYDPNNWSQLSSTFPLKKRYAQPLLFLEQANPDLFFVCLFSFPHRSHQDCLAQHGQGSQRALFRCHSSQRYGWAGRRAVRVNNCKYHTHRCQRQSTQVSSEYVQFRHITDLKITLIFSEVKAISEKQLVVKFMGKGSLESIWIHQYFLIFQFFQIKHRDGIAKILKPVKISFT